eukprot:scaffold144680_cov14-Tisochrysis_lutea.AAC.1
MPTVCFSWLLISSLVKHANPPSPLQESVPASFLVTAQAWARAGRLQPSSRCACFLSGGMKGYVLWKDLRHQSSLPQCAWCLPAQQACLTAMLLPPGELTLIAPLNQASAVPPPFHGASGVPCIVKIKAEM